MAAIDYFIKFDGITGGSTDTQHKGEIDVLSWSWGAQVAPGAGAGAGASKPQVQDFHFVMRAGSASPALLKKLATGAHIPTTVLTGRFDKLNAIVIKFGDVLVTSFETSASAGEAPAEEVGFNFKKLDFSVTPQAPSGSGGSASKVMWDLKASTVS